MSDGSSFFLQSATLSYLLIGVPLFLIGLYGGKFFWKNTRLQADAYVEENDRLLIEASEIKKECESVRIAIEELDQSTAKTPPSYT